MGQVWVIKVTVLVDSSAVLCCRSREEKWPKGQEDCNPKCEKHNGSVPD